MSNQSQAIERAPTRAQQLTKLFERSSSKLAQVAPKHITPERMVRLLAASLSRVPKLAECDEGSLLIALMTATQLGLEPNTPLGHGYIIPVWNSKRGCNEAQFWPGYRGLVHLAEQTGVIKGIRSRLVRARDLFEYEDTHKGEVWRFVPADGDRGEIRKVFAVANRAEGFPPSIEIMTLAEVIAIRDSSPSARGKYGLSGPWVTHFDEMMRKTGIKRLTKQIPLSTEDDTEDPERPMTTPTGRFVRALSVDTETDATIEAMLSDAASLPELGGPTNVPAADPNAKPVAESSSTPATTTAPSDAKEGKGGKKSRAEGAKEKAAAAKPKDAPASPPPPDPEPTPEPEPKPATDTPPPPSSSSESDADPAAVVEDPDNATSDPEPEEEDDSFEPPPDELEAPPAPPAPPAASKVDTEITKIEACKSVADIRAWYDSVLPRWDAFSADERKPIMTRYKAKSAELSKG